MESLKDEARTNAAAYINEIMDEAKLNANQQASLNEANGYLRSISKTLQDAGHNEYIALKEANVSSYLRRIY